MYSLTARPWAERGSCSAAPLWTGFIFILTARPWAECGSRSAQGFVGEQSQTFSRPNFESRNVWCLFAKSCWNINTRTMLRILFSLLCLKDIFFGFIEALASKGIFNTLKIGITSPWNALTLQLSLSLRDK